MKKEQSVALILLKDVGPVILVWLVWIGLGFLLYRLIRS